MPHKIKFKVLHVSGHDEGCNPLDLEVHGPLVQGWVSSRYCLYPQVIVFKIEKRVRVRKLQVLCHQFLIPSKVEFFLGEGPLFESSTDQNIKYSRLGYIALSDNEKTGFKARELKSVYVDAIGSYLKLVIYKNHVNRYNLFNQVGVIAANVIGEEVSNVKVRDTNVDVDNIIDAYIPGFSMDTTKNGLNPREDPMTLGAINTRSDYISPLEDLAFEMYQDAQVANIIRKLDQKKQKAVKEERFEHAKKLKQAITDLTKVGEKLGKYEVEKRRAIENEDFDLAQQKKAQMEEYRAHIKQQLDYHGLLDDRVKPHYKQQPLPPAKLRTKSPEKPPVEEVIRTVTPSPPPQKQEEIMPPSPSPPVTPDPPTRLYDDRPLPIRQSPEVEVLDSYRDESINLDSQEPEELSELQLREAAPVIDVFGHKMVAGAYSKQWAYREDALNAVYKYLKEVPADKNREECAVMMKNAIFLCRRAILDKVNSVFNAAIKLLRMILVEYIPKHHIHKHDTIYAVDKTLPNLVHKTGETNQRQRQTAKDFVNDMALMSEVKPLHIVPQYCTQPIEKNAQTRLATSRAEIVEQLQKDLGLDKSGLLVDDVMNFCVHALDHNAQEVREVTVRIIIELYRMKGDVIRNYLPPDTDNTRKNVLYRIIFEGFDRIDGREHDSRVEKDDLKTSRSDNTKGHGAGTTSRTAVSRKSAPSSDGGDDVSQAFDKECIFCNEKNELFNQEGLDVHYWKECPMLRKCQHCRQVVEIANLTSHLLTECDRKSDFGKCNRCSEAIPSTELESHTLAKACNASKPEKQANHCPLCHINFAPGEDGWKMHLMGKDGCKENPRRLPSLSRAKAQNKKYNSKIAQPKPVAGSTSTKPGKTPRR